MSYDLQFRREEPLTEAEFFAFFEGRRSYTREHRQVLYRNADTGVCFIFSWNDSSGVEDREKAGFSLAFCRPHFFGREAAIILNGFSKHFGFTVHDRQAEREGTFLAEDFVRVWDQCNRMITPEILRRAGGKVLSRPRSELESVWICNLARRRIQKELGAAVFVPAIKWLKIDNKLCSVVMWPDGVATLIPAVDKIVVPRSVVPRGNLLPDAEPIQLKDVCIVDQAALDCGFCVRFFLLMAGGG
jgi:hypothetical protein